MKPASVRGMPANERVAPRQQHNWDWRAAANFIFGGAGGGLLLAASLAAGGGAEVRLAAALGMLLIGLGLTCVWFEIGRPWRALNVYRHIRSSWMTREAAFAPLVFAAGGAYVTGMLASAAVLLVAGFCGVGFLYSQGRILASDKGIPAWRHPRCLPLVVATGLTEGMAFLALFPLGSTRLAPVVMALVALLAVRLILWRRYLAGLRADGAPQGSLKALGAMDVRFVAVGNVVPMALGLLAAALGQSLLLFLAGLLAIHGGWWLKWTLVRRAAFTQGIALTHLPVRGRGPSGAAVKPGWGGAAS